jgi:uncharacterized membrane protein YfcA
VPQEVSVHIYLPIAGVSVDAISLLALGTIVGILSGIFGVGGGFLLTPFLIFMGIPAPVAVASGANQVVGASMSGVIAHWRRGNVDVRMGMALLAGGLVGSLAGVELFGYLKKLGQIDLVIGLSYVIMLGSIGGSMAYESLLAMLRRRGRPSTRKRHRHLASALPWKMRFPKSGLYISVLMPFGVGAFGGVLAAIMGVGGGFILVPLMIYVLEMPTKVVIGTSLFQVIFVTANVTFLQAVRTHTVDVILALVLLIGGVIGAQFGSRLGAKLPGEKLRGLLALLVLAVCAKMTFDLFATPIDIYTVADTLK